MMARWHEDIFSTLEELNIGFIAFSPLANGLLSDFYTADSKFNPENDYRAAMPQFSRESFEENEMLFQLIRRLADEKHATPSQISLAWMLCKKPYIVPIPGTRHLCRLKENIGAADINLSTDEVEAIDRQLDSIPMSEVFGGSKIVEFQKA
jgi:aryl-alcohol dehydrogenase-like predicted oxidoreductase